MSLLNYEISLDRPAQILIGLIAASVLLAAITIPASMRQDHHAENVDRARQEYSDTAGLIDRYEALKQSASSKGTVLLEEPLFSYVGKVTRSLNLAKKIDYVRPDNRTDDEGNVTEIVQVAFKGVTQQEFIGFLYRIEVQKKEIFVRNISIKKDSNKNFNTQMTLQKRN